MADASYNQGAYRKQGANYVVIASGGYLQAESGGTIQVDSGGALTQAGTMTNSGTLNNSGSIVNTTAGKIRESVQTASTAQALRVNGISIIGSTAAGALNYTLAKPSLAGLRKTIVGKNSTGALTVTVSTAATVNLTTTRKFTWIASADNQAVELVASSSVNWFILHRSTGITCT